MKVYKRSIQVNIKCGDGQMFVLKTKVLINAKDYTESETKIREQFPALLQTALQSGVEIVKLNFL